MKIQTNKGIAEGLPLSDIQENNKWLKVIAVSFAIFVFFLIAFVLWLKFSGIGHNIIYEISPKSDYPKETGRFYHDMDYSKDNYIDYWNDMWEECEFGEKNYEAVRKEWLGQ